jgi:hypothetical protein
MHTYATGSGFTVGREDTLQTKPDAQGSATTLANNITVTSSGSGRMVSRTLGNGIVQAVSFNLRSQLTNVDATLSLGLNVDIG